jgi:hypothetical protein
MCIWPTPEGQYVGVEMPLRIAMVALVALAFTATATVDKPRAPITETTDGTPTTCPVTEPPARAFIPPAPWPDQKRSPREFWFGTRRLWTVLQTDGTWKGLPHYTPDDPTFRQKLFWWRHGDDVRPEPEENLTVTGRRLDAPAPPLHVDPIGNGWPRPDQMFKVVGVNFPTLGCWEVKGQYRGALVTYIVRVTE